MSSPPGEELTRLLHEWSNGQARTPCRVSWSSCIPSSIASPRGTSRRERAGHTLQPTALVSEAYMRLAQQQPGKQWNDRTHFFAVAARVVRAVLVDHARARGAVKRGDGAVGVELAEGHASVAARPVDLLDLDAALVELEAMNAEQSRIVELRYFAGTLDRRDRRGARHLALHGEARLARRQDLDPAPPRRRPRGTP